MVQTGGKAIRGLLLPTARCDFDNSSGRRFSRYLSLHWRTCGLVSTQRTYYINVDMPLTVVTSFVPLGYDSNFPTHFQNVRAFFDIDGSLGTFQPQRRPGRFI